ncbi:MAG: hypothetical protein JWN01_844 [Patescibacteria group bacterium]|nr:hypothetical protein [Patescibacteria group bacterium]
MINFPNVIIGLLMSAAGIAFVRFSYQISNMTGPQDWLENITGPGTTNGIYKIFGVIVMALGLFVATGFGNNVMTFLLGPLRGIFGPYAK